MPLRTCPEGYGLVAKGLHWATVVALLAQAVLVVPATGIALLLSGDDDLTWLHVAAHLVLYAAVASHLWLVLRRRLLLRMLPGVKAGRQERAAHG